MLTCISFATCSNLALNTSLYTVMVATSRIATAAQIDSLYLPGGADVHPCQMHGSLGAQESVNLPYTDLDRFGRICTSHGLHRQTEKPRYVATSSANVHKLHIQSLLGSRVVSVLDSGAPRPGFKSQPRRCRVTVFGKLFTPIVPLFTKQRNW